VSRDSSGNFAAGTITANLSGTASAATLAQSAVKLQTARRINGIFFDGTSDITVPAADKVKAWVRFTSNGSIISSFNVGSVTRLGSGRYRVNINPGVFLNGNFAAAGMASDVDHFVSMNTYSVGGATSSTRIDVNTVDNGSGNDSPSNSAETMIILVA
jgi:hypothetical protein